MAHSVIGTLIMTPKIEVRKIRQAYIVEFVYKHAKLKRYTF